MGPDDGPFVGHDKQVEELLGEEEADHKGDEKRADRPDQPGAQLHQMLDERLRLVFDVTAHASSFGVSFVFGARLRTGALTAASSTAWATGAGFAATRLRFGFSTIDAAAAG